VDDKPPLKGMWSEPHDPFLPQDAMLARCMLSSCVCLSITSRYCGKMAKLHFTTVSGL